MKNQYNGKTLADFDAVEDTSQRLYLNAIASCGLASYALRAAAQTKQVLASWRREDSFRELEQEAMEAFRDRFELRAQEAALGGDNKMLQFILRAERPEKFRERFDMSSRVTLQRSDPAELSEAELLAIVADKP